MIQESMNFVDHGLRAYFPCVFHFFEIVLVSSNHSVDIHSNFNTYHDNSYHD